MKAALPLDKECQNLPREYELEDYSIATERFIEKYSKHPDVVSIYQFGQVSVPGISDLDFIVVLKDPLSHSFDADYSVSTFSPELRYLYNDTQPFLMNEGIFKEFWKIFPTSDLTLVYGRKIEQIPASDNEKDVYNLLILVDVCNYFYPLLFVKQLASNTLNVRFCLLVLNSFKFPLRLCMDLTGQVVDGWVKFIEKVESLRKSWFLNDLSHNLNALNSLLSEASSVSLGLIGTLDTFMREHYWCGNSTNQERVAGTYGACHFTGLFDKDAVLHKILDRFNKTKTWRSYLPTTLLYPLTLFAHEEGVVSNHIKKKLTHKVGSFHVKDERVTGCLRSRAELMNRHASFYADNTILINMVHNYYGYNPLKEKNKTFLSAVSMLKKFTTLKSSLRRL
jgi:hypothetical protein